MAPIFRKTRAISPKPTFCSFMSKFPTWLPGQVLPRGGDKMKCEDGTTIRTRIHADPALMRNHDLLNDREAEAGTDGYHAFTTPEPLENPFSIFWRDT